MAVSVETVENEIRLLLRKGIRNTINNLGLPDTSDAVASVLENLCFLLFLYPPSIYTLFYRYLSLKQTELDEYLTSVRTLYGDRYLAGFPVDTSGVYPTNTYLDNAVYELRVFDAAFSAESTGTVSTLGRTQDELDAINTQLVNNLSSLTVPEARSMLSSTLSDIENSYADCAISELENYTSNFDTLSLSLGQSPLASIAEAIRLRLSSISSELDRTSLDDAVTSSLSYLAATILSGRLLDLLNTETDPEGAIVVSSAEAYTMPNDDLIVSGTAGRTRPDLIIYEGEDPLWPLQVTADPLSVDDEVTQRLRGNFPARFALEIDVDIVEENLVDGTGNGDPIMRCTGIMEAILPDRMYDADGFFQAYDVQGGDEIYRSVAVFDYLTVDSLLAGSEQTTIITLDMLAPGTVFTYEIYRPTTNLFVDTDANFGPSLAGSRIELDGIGTAYISRVVDANTLQLSEYILPVTFTPGGPPTCAAVDYAIYMLAEPGGRTIEITSADNLMMYSAPPGTRVIFDPNTDDEESATIVTVVHDREFRIDRPVVTGSRTALVLDRVRPGDVVQMGSTRCVVKRVIEDDLLLVSPQVDYSLTDQDALVLPPNASLYTKRFHDSSVDFVSEGVAPGNLLILTVGDTLARVPIEKVDTNVLRLKRQLAINREDVEYKIVSKDDELTTLIDSTENMAPVMADDMLAVESMPPSSVVTVPSASELTVLPELPVSPEVFWGVITRGGVEGYPHYAMVQERLFGPGGVSLRSPSYLHTLYGILFADMGDSGTLVTSDADLAWVDPETGGDHTDQVSTATATGALQFGDAIILSVTTPSGPETWTVYAKEWGGGLVSFFPSVKFDGIVLDPNFEVRRSKTSDCLYEARQIELSILGVKQVLDDYYPPPEGPMAEFLDYLDAHRYDRIRDLLVAGDIESIASITESGLSYAGRLEELLNQAVALLGEEEDIFL